MAERRFLEEGHITTLDLEAVLDLSAVGWFAWRRASGGKLINSSIADSQSEEAVSECNLREVRVAMRGVSDTHFEGLELMDAAGATYSVVSTEQSPTLSLAERVLYVARFAGRQNDGRLSGRIQPCHTCYRDTGHIGMCDAPYGLPGAIMAGSERIECTCCGTSKPLRQT